MDYEQFISSVEDAVGPADGPVALRSLADRLSGVPDRQVFVRLARDPAPTPPPDGPPVHIDVDEYRPRVRERRQPKRASRYRSAEAGVPTLLDVLGPEVFERWAIQRSDDDSAVRPPPVASVVPLSFYFGRIVAPAHVVEDVPKRFADAVLETLAERIGPVAVDGLVERLPAELRPVLRHARHIYPGTGKHVRLQRLLDHVAERDDGCPMLDVQPERPMLAVRTEADPEIELLHLARHLAFRLPSGYAVRWMDRSRSPAGGPAGHGSA
ncbi:DUF2267 domain-containing protein [Jatrophihabitans sp. DSM 45814]